MLTHDRQAFLDAERSKWLSITEAAFILTTTRAIIGTMLRNGTLLHRREGKVIRIHIDDLRPTTPEARHALSTLPLDIAFDPVRAAH